MGKRARIAIRYCGGCNPHYDRAAAVDIIKGELAGLAEFGIFKPDEDYDFVIVVQGCSRECVLRRGGDEPANILFVTGEDDAKEAASRIKAGISEVK